MFAPRRLAFLDGTGFSSLFIAVAAEFAAMLVRASFVDFNAHYEEDLFWIRVMLGTSLGSVLAALCGKGAGRLWSLVTGCMILAFVMLVGSIPP